eukprot:scaffold10_cov257-Pinguiococcus_pyrenoidosus.AAC.55
MERLEAGRHDEAPQDAEDVLARGEVVCRVGGFQVRDNPRYDVVRDGSEQGQVPGDDLHHQHGAGLRNDPREAEEQRQLLKQEGPRVHRAGPEHRLEGSEDCPGLPLRGLVDLLHRHPERAQQIQQHLLEIEAQQHFGGPPLLRRRDRAAAVTVKVTPQGLQARDQHLVGCLRFAQLVVSVAAISVAVVVSNQVAAYHAIHAILVHRGEDLLGADHREVDVVVVRVQQVDPHHLGAQLLHSAIQTQLQLEGGAAQDLVAAVGQRLHDGGEPKNRIEGGVAGAQLDVKASLAKRPLPELRRLFVVARLEVLRLRCLVGGPQARQRRKGREADHPEQMLAQHASRPLLRFHGHLRPESGRFQLSAWLELLRPDLRHVQRVGVADDGGNHVVNAAVQHHVEELHRPAADDEGRMLLALALRFRRRHLREVDGRVVQGRAGHAQAEILARLRRLQRVPPHIHACAWLFREPLQQADEHLEELADMGHLADAVEVHQVVAQVQHGAAQVQEVAGALVALRAPGAIATAGEEVLAPLRRGVEERIARVLVVEQAPRVQLRSEGTPAVVAADRSPRRLIDDVLGVDHANAIVDRDAMGGPALQEQTDQQLAVRRADDLRHVGAGHDGAHRGGVIPLQLLGKVVSLLVSVSAQRSDQADGCHVVHGEADLVVPSTWAIAARNAASQAGAEDLFPRTAPRVGSRGHRRHELRRRQVLLVELQPGLAGDAKLHHEAFRVLGTEAQLDGLKRLVRRDHQTHRRKQPFARVHHLTQDPDLVAKARRALHAQDVEEPSVVAAMPQEIQQLRHVSLDRLDGRVLHHVGLIRVGGLQHPAR